MSDLPGKPQIEPLVSVIMPCYKMGRFIGQALESVGKQTYTNWEVIAVDDCGPEDGTQEIVARFAREFPNNRVVCHRHEKNQGVSAARNTAASLAFGEYLAFLDPDDYWLSQHLKNTSYELIADKQCGVVCSPVEAFWDNKENKNIIWNFNWQKDLFPDSISCLCFILTSGVVLRKTLFEEAHGFLTNLHPGEDYDLWIRMVKNGVNFKFLDERSCMYRKHSTSSTAEKKYMAQARERMIESHTAFFHDAQGKLILNLFSRISRLENYQKMQSGFFMRSLMRCDGLLRKIKKILLQIDCLK
jgi:glycosyltransferase involved in cell wall biosynthesis